jgi:hypothetical protein
VAAAMPEVKEGKQEAGSLSVMASFLTKISELIVDAAVCQQMLNGRSIPNHGCVRILQNNRNLQTKAKTKNSSREFQ